MSTQNDFINYQNVIKEINSLINNQITLWGDVVVAIKKLENNSPSGLVNSQKKVNETLQQSVELQTKLDAVETKRKATVQQILTTGTALEKQRQKEIAQQERKAQATAKAAAREQAQLAKSENLYNKIQAKVNALTATYNNLAAKKELGLKLNDRELAQLNSLEGRLNKYNGVLKQVDATIGKNQRNVGNYASGFDGLGNSINQITRELPAFAFSAQTGFMALSNNIPILADEINRISNNVKNLREQGQQVPSVMSQILKSFLSWQTLLSLGVTLITIYGKEIGEWIGKMFKAKEAIDWAKRAKEELNNTMRDGVKNAQKEIIELNNYIKVAQNANLSTNERVKSANKLKETYPEYFKNMTTDQIMTSDLTKIQNELTTALISRATALASISKMTENATKILDLEEENRLANENLLLLKERAKNEQRLFDEQVKTSKANVFATQVNKSYSAIEETQEDIIKRAEEITNLQIRNAELAKIAEANTAKSANLETTTPIKKEKDRTKELLDEEYRLQVARINQMEDGTAKELELLQAWYEYQQELHKDNANELLIIQLDYWSKLKDINDDNLKKQQKDKEEADKLFLAEQDKLFKEDEKNTEEYNKAVAYWDEWRTQKALKEAEERNEIVERAYESIKGFASDVDFGTLGFSSLDFLNDLETISVAWESGLMSMQEKTAFIMKAIQGIMTDVFNAMTERQNAYFEQQFKNLETEKDLALQFAGENTAGREAIEKQYDEKKTALQMEQAKREKRMAIAQANINIASAILSALATQPVWVGIAMAALVGVLGAVQLATIASTPLPQFYTGTSNAPEGLALTQERGAEMITDKHGNIKTLGNNKGAQLTYLNKGDKVFTADETTQKLNELLISSGVSPIVNVSGGSGMSKEDMREVLNDTLAKQPKNSIIFDENGIKAFTSKENRRTILKNRNVKI